MSAEDDPANRNYEPNGLEVQHMMQRHDGFADGLGLDEAITLQIVGQVLTDMPMRTDDERLVEARMRMVAAAMA